MTNKYIWYGPPEGYLDAERYPAYMVPTHVPFKFGQKVYLNKNGYAQRRETEIFLGYCIYPARNLSFKKHLIANEKLRNLLLTLSK